jgi:hypothetical protein
MQGSKPVMGSFLVAAFLLIFGGNPSHAAVTLQAGEWQSTETGIENGKPAKPEIEKSCMTPEEARDAANLVNQMKKEMQAQGSQCEKLDVRQSGNDVSFAFKCGMGQQFIIDIAGTFTLLSATRYAGTLKSTVKMGANTMTSDKKIEAVRVGDCKADHKGK